ncbi:uncharacterized protein LOC132286132 [Cornus florida]|uniref:uncharacterized protein LOC132286132 n=1 Tax=Cornus florida TaxID=4283 RepID=UPI00289C5855|nr:uncharacterized protein LOC132286132 [Cornus florida]
MDFSSLTEAQQQQLQQLQQQFLEHQRQQQQQEQAQQQQQQQQIQNYASQSYDPSQVVQSYDQSYYPYYQYQDPQQSQHSQPQPPQSQQQYAYYQSDSTNEYQQQPQHQHYSQPELAPVHPPGVSIPHEAPPQSGESGGAAAVSGQGQVQVQHQQSAYYPQQAPPVGEQQISGYPVPVGLNAAAAAAVAALSQLTQFAGTMDAAERAMAGFQERQWHGRGGGYGMKMDPGPMMGPGPMHHGRGPMHPPVGRSPYRGGGRRGGGQFRGGGRGNFGNRPPRSGGLGPPFRGKGRGRGRGGPRGSAPHDATSSSNPEPSAEEEELTEEAEPSADNHEEELQDAVPTETSALVQGSAVPNRPHPQVAWCELCRVDCTSLEILEQHKNGKRHKKNLQRFEELKSASKPVTENEQKPVSDLNPEATLQPENVREGEENKETLPANLPNGGVTDENKVENEQSNVQARRPSMNRFDNQRRGMKRKMRGGRGGKRMKTSDTPRWPVEPPKPKVVIPLICDLCNVKCDTQEVFDRHLAGKKHISKLKRFEGHQAMYGPMGLQALYPPNPIAQSLLLPQGPQQAFYGHQGSYPPPGAYMPPQAHNGAPAATFTGSGLKQDPNPQVSEASAQFAGQEAVPKAQPQSALQTKSVNGAPESEGMGLNTPLDYVATEGT